MRCPAPAAERNSSYLPLQGMQCCPHGDTEPTLWKFTEYDRFADRALCDDVMRSG
jgi:hypothetical protein